MRRFVKPIVVVSKCIEFAPVRWDGRIISSGLVKQLKNHLDFKPVCPEVEIGLGVPRETLRIVKIGQELRLLQPATGLDLTEKMQRFSKDFLDSLKEVDGFILKSGSPSSAIKDARIYPSIGKVAVIGRGPGFFGKAVLERYPQVASEDEKRLLNNRIREHFLTKLFTIGDFRAVKNSGSGKELVAFQARNKLLFTAYSQVHLNAMGRIVAERKKRTFAETIADYQVHFYAALKFPPRRGANSNVLTKAAGYFTRQLTHAEKTFFLDSVDKYTLGLLPLSAPLNILREWIIRFNEEYLQQQTFFEPFPESLATLETSTSPEEKNYWK